MEPELTVRVATLWLGEDGIVRIIHVPGAVVSLEDAQETMEAYLTINKGKPRPLLIDTRTLTSLSREARKFYAGEDAAKVACAAAIIVGTPVSRVSGNFSLVSPVRIFRADSSSPKTTRWSG